MRAEGFAQPPCGTSLANCVKGAEDKRAKKEEKRESGGKVKTPASDGVSL
jgi:hypothetical protein